jgi:16S rRNA (adenine1518-N6/adenine1519-N6)-dimethyltransferase
MGFQSRVKPKRSLGQNFFINEDLVKKVIKTVLESKPKHITEIGSGKGAFTKAFYGVTTSLTLVEKDKILAQNLESMFPEAKVYNLDILTFELDNPDTTYFGSLPFNISKEIIEKIIKSYTFNNPAFFIIQKEVAEKYRNNYTNSLGLIREIYADCKKIFDINPGNFRPRPNVTATFIKFIPHDKYKDINKEELELLIQRSFTKPRKTLHNNLKMYDYNLSKTFSSKRAAQLSLEEYISILKAS